MDGQSTQSSSSPGELAILRRRVAELEQVAAERQRAEETLRQSEERYRRLVEMSPDAIGIGREGLVVFLNATGMKMLGATDPAQILGQPFMRFVAPEFREEAGRRLRSILEQGATVEFHEEPFMRLDGTRFSVELTAVPVLYEGRGAVQVIFRDITPRQRMIAELRDSEARTRALLDAIPDMMFRIRADGQYLDFRADPGEELLLPRDQVIGSNLRDTAMPGAWVEQVLDAIAATLETGAVQVVEYVVPRVPHPRRREARLVRSGPDEVVAIIRDITQRQEREAELRAYQERLRSMARQLAQTQERERRQIARDLHDQIGQHLAISSIKLQVLRTQARSPAVRQALTEVHGLLQEAIGYTRSLMSELSPPVLYELGLAAALEWLAERTQERHGLKVAVAADGQSPALGEALRMALFQAVRELLVNVVKHARARQAVIRVQHADGWVRVTVADDGVGFDVAAGSPSGISSGGFGLFSIRERLDGLGGRLEIESMPGKGTQAVLVAPLAS